MAEHGEPLLIVADHYRMAVMWAHEHGLGPESAHRWIYVTTPHQVQGRRGGRYVTISAGDRSPRDWRQRADLLEVLRTHGFRPLDDD